MKINFKRFLSFVLAFVMVFGLFPANVFATGEETTEEFVDELIIDESGDDAAPSEEEEIAPVTTDPVAKVGDTEYATIDEAIAAWTNGTTLTLLADVTLSDVIKLSSTEYHILDLGTYTMTAAKNKDAIQYVVNGRSSASYALDIKADATNPGGITANGGSVVRHTKPLTGAPSKDRPITRFYGGVFNASYVVRQGGTFGAGYTGASAPHFYFYGGEYNGTIYTNRSINQFYGGTFNGTLSMSVDSSAYTLIAGGTFKYLSNLMNSELTSEKFTIGSEKSANNGSVCIDENGNYVITTTTPTAAEAAVASNYNSNNYFYYSTVNTDGMYYEDVYDALEANETGTVTVLVDELDLSGSSFTGTIVVPEDSRLTITNAPANLKVTNEAGETLTPNANGSYSTIVPTGTITFGFTSETGVWGEGGGNAYESLVVELYKDETQIASASLNNIDGIIDGDVYVTWHIPFAGSNDAYWDVEWAEGHPNKNDVPTAVKMVIDGAMVAENAVQMNGPDNLNKVEWDKLEALQPDVAMINGKGYKSLQAALNAAYEMGGTVTVTLVEDITEKVTVTEKVGLYLTIDGKGKTVDGSITIKALSDTNDNRRTTIQNVNFVNKGDSKVDFISSVETNHYPRITVIGCDFKGNGQEDDVAIRLKSSYGAEIKSCFGTGLHSFLQNTSGHDLTIEKVSVSDSKSGLALGTVQGVTVENCKITVKAYGVRMDAKLDNKAVISNNTVEAFIPVVVRDAEGNSNITVSGTNTMNATNTDRLWLAIGTSEYEENGKKPTASTGKVVVTLNDTGVDKDGVYGNYFFVATIGDAEYKTLAEAIKAAKAGDTITFADNITENVTINKSVTIDGAGKTYTGMMTVNNVTVTIDNVNFVKGQVYKHKGTGSAAVITIKNCDFDGQGMDAYAVNVGNGKSLTIENVTAKDYGYGLLQIPSAFATVAVKDVEISDVYYGLKIDYSGAVVLENVKIADSVTIGIYDSNFGAKTYTIKNCDLSAATPIKIWERPAAMTTTFAFDGVNTIPVLPTSQYAKIVAEAENGTMIGSLVGVVAAAKSGDTVKVLKDATGEVQIPENAELKLDLNGKTLNGYIKPFKGNLTVENGSIVNTNKSVSGIEITAGELVLNNVNITSARHAVRVEGAATVTIDGGVYMIDPIAKGTYHAVNVGGAGGEKVTIKGGTFIGPKSTMADSGAAVHIRANAEVTIEGGNFSGGKLKTLSNAGKLTVTGGTFDQNPADYLPEDYCVKVDNGSYEVGKTNYVDVYTEPTLDADGYTTYTCQHCGHTYVVTDEGSMVKTVAKIGEKKFASLAEAIAAAQAGETVTIMAGEYTTTLNVNKAITVEGEGNVTIKGKLNITANGATVKNLTVKNSGTACYINAKDVLVEGCNLSGSNGLYQSYTSGTVTFKNSAITGSTYGVHFDGSKGGNIVIDNCVITGWTSFAGTINKVTMTNTKFAEGNYNRLRFYQDVEMTNVEFNPNMTVDFGKNEVEATFTGCSVSDGSALTEVIYLPDIAQMGVEVKIDNEPVVVVAMIGNTAYLNLADAYAAAKDGDEVMIYAAGSYKLPTGKSITITGKVDGVVFDNIGAHGMGGASVTFNNVTFNYADNSTYKGLQHCGDMVYNNCTFNGQVFLYGNSEIFNDCTFNQTTGNYNVWTYGAKKVEFNNCTFNSAGKSVLVYAESAAITNAISVTNSTFNASAAVDGKAAIEIDTSLTGGATITIDAATTANGFDNGNVSGNSLWNNKKGSNTDANNDITVKVGDETVLAPVTFVAYIGKTGYTTIADAIAAAQTGETVTIMAGEYTGALNVNKAITVAGEGDVTIKGRLNITANGATVKNLTVKNSGTACYINAKDVLVEGCNLSGSNGLYQSYTSGTVTFKDSTITGSTYGVHFDGKAGGNIVIDNCVITGWTSFASSIKKVTMTNTKFAEGNYNYVRFYQEEAVIEGCTFNEKMAVDLAVSGAKLTVTSSTVENGNVEDLFSGADIVNSTITVDGEKLVRVAKIGGAYYETLQAAIDAAQNGETVTLLTDSNEDVTVSQTADKSITIDGNSKVYSGTITIHGNARHNGAETLTIQNFKFETSEAGHYFIDSNSTGSVERYAHNVTVKNSTFTATGAAEHSAAAMRIRQGFNISIKNVTATGMHSVLQAYGNAGVSVKDLTATNMKNGISVGTSTGVVIERANIAATGYGVRADGTGAYDLTVKDSVIKANDPVVVRNATKDGYSVTVEGSTLNGSNANGYGVIFTAKDDGTYVEPTVGIQLNGASEQNVFPVFMAKIGNVGYASFAAAYAAAQNGTTIELLADVEATEVILIDKSLTINGNGHKVISNATRVFRVTASNVEVTLNNVNMVSRTVMTYPNDIRGISIDAGLSNVKLTLNDSSVDFTDASACDWAYAVNVSGNGTGHTVTVNGGSYEGANVINVHSAGNTVIVKNAVLNCLYPNNDMYSGACIWVLQNQGSSVEATGNTFNGSNAVAFNLGTGTALTESNNVDNTKAVVAKVGSEYYTSLADAFAAVNGNGEVILLHNVALSETVKVPAFKARTTNGITLNLNGKTIKGTDNATGSFALIELQPGAELTVTGNGAITLTATNNRGWNAYSSVISNQRGKLTVEGGTIEHLGGTDMAYGIDNLTNGKGTYAELVIEGGTIKSTYRAIRQFLNGTEAQNILTVTGGTIEGGNKSVWMQDANKSANPGSLTIGANAVIKGDVYLSATAGSTEWPVELSVAAEALKDGATVLTSNVPYGKVVENVNGKWIVREAAYVAKIGDKGFESLAAAIAAANTGDTITFVDTITESVTINKSVTINGAGMTYTGRMKLTNKANITIKNVNFDGKGYDGYAIETRGANYLTIDGCTAKNYGYGFVQLASATVLTTVKNVTVSNMNYGVKVDYSTAVVLENVDITANVAAVMNSNYGTKTITIKNSEFSTLRTWKRNDNHKTTYIFEGANSIDQFVNIQPALDNFKLANTTSTLTAPAGQTVTVDQAGYSVKYVDGKYVAKADMVAIGEETYASLAEALAAAQAGDTITFLADITEDVTTTKAVTIDGAGKTYTGAMTLKADTTIKNVNFDGKGYNGYAITTRGANYLTIEDCTAVNYGYGFVQLASGTALTTVKNVTVSGMNYGVKVDYSNAVVLENVDITVGVAAVLNSNYGEKTITIKDSKLNILGTWVRDNTTKTTYVFEGANSIDKFITEAAIDNFKLNAGATLTAPEGINVTTDVDRMKVKYEEGTYKLVKAAIAKIGNVEYSSLQEAVDAANAGATIKLIADAEGPGVVIDKNLTIDFAGHTYSLTVPVGSTGTESNGFQILAGNTVTLRNGTLKVADSAADKFYILIQNYADLKLNSITLDGRNLDKYAFTDGDSYVLSNNSGNSSAIATKIIVNDNGDKAVAFDVCKFGNYTEPIMNIKVADAIYVDETTLAVDYAKYVEAAAFRGNYHYATLQQAVDLGGTVTLFKDIAGPGVVIRNDVNINFANHTYTITEPVGSTGTESNGFQILKGTDVVFRNGTLKVADSVANKFYILVQNYSDSLSMSSMTLDGTNLDKYAFTDGDSYTLSNNSGNVNIGTGTKIIANNDGALAFAFDACDQTDKGYDLPVVTVHTRATIEGNIEAAAKIGNVYYANLQQAIDAAGNGKTITMMSNIKVDTADAVKTASGQTVMFNIEGKSLTLDMNGKTIDVAYDSSELMYAVVCVADGASLTVKGEGAINLTTGDTLAGEYDCVAYMFWKRGTTGELNIENGTFTANKLEDSMVYTNGDKIVSVKGGTWTLGNVATGSNNSPWIFNTAGQNARTILVSGGTYNFNVAKQHYALEVSIVDAKGNLSYVVDNGNGTWTVTGETAEVGIVTGTWNATYLYGYATFKDAVNSIAKGAPETTIVLMKDINVKGQFIGYNYPMQVVVDLNGYKMSSTDRVMTVYRPGTVLTLKNGTVYGNTTAGGINVANKGKLVLGENVSITSSNAASALRVEPGATLVIDQPTSYVLGGKNDLIVADGANVQISAGYFKHPVDAAWCAEGLVPTGLLENGYYSVTEDPSIGMAAQIGNEYFETIQAAVNDAENDAVITVLADHELVWDDETFIDGSLAAMVVVAGKSVTIDLNGKKLTVDANKMNGTDLYAVFAADEGGSLTLTGEGTVEATGTAFAASKTTAYCLMMAYEAGTELIVVNGTYTMESAHDSLVYTGSDECVTIKNGTYTLGNQGTGDNGKPWIFNGYGKNANEILVRGGTFNADVNHQFWANEVDVLETLALKSNGDGTWTVVEAAAYVEEIGRSQHSRARKVGYATVAEAYAAAKNGQQVTILNNGEAVQPEIVETNEVTALDSALATGGNVSMTEDMTISTNDTTANSGYGKTGVKVNGGSFNGNGNTLNVPDANGTWDCAVNAVSGVIENVKITGAFRGIFMGGANGDVYINNVTVKDVVYTFNSDGGNKNYGVYISNTTLKGWTSFSNVHKEVVFTGCTFGEGNGYAFCRPYNASVFENCVFEVGFEFDTTQNSNIVFKNCYYGDTLITAENAATLGNGETTFFCYGLKDAVIE